MLRLAVLTLALALTSASLEANWLVYKQTHKKVYTGDEDAVRRSIWQANHQKIEQHNERYAQGLSSFYLGENQFADMTQEEVSKVMSGSRVKKQLNPGLQARGPHADNLPAHVDWRTKGYVTPIKDQGQCGSCWAFSTTGSVEGQHFKATGKLVSLSESNLMDCSVQFGNNGCGGGFMDNAFKYIINNTGIDTEASYPYNPQDDTCKFNTANIGATISSYTDVDSGNEDALKHAVAKIGPVSVAIDASKASFTFYKGGIYDEPACNNTELDHGVLAVGYGVQDGKHYWIVKNSWAVTWGTQGYILMSRNKDNQCGIATAASYPNV